MGGGIRVLAYIRSGVNKRHPAKIRNKKEATNTQTRSLMMMLKYTTGNPTDQINTSTHRT